MFQPNPPAPKAMPDDQLNARIAELQLQPNGLVAAMSLIEEQSKLRQEDALELSKWQLEAQMLAATEYIAQIAADFTAPIVTDVLQVCHYTRAEDEHQHYFERHPYQGYCQAVIAPKVAKIKATLPDFLA